MFNILLRGKTERMDMSPTETNVQTIDKKNRNTGENQETYEIDLVELFYRVIEKMKYIILVAVLGALLAGLYTHYLVTPIYTATSKLYVLNSDDSVLNLSDLQIGTYLASDYQEVFSNWHVHEMVIERLGLDYSYGQLSNMVSVSNPASTRILYIRVKSDDPDEAKTMADEYAKVAQEFIAVKMETKEPNIFEEALRPSAPSSPNMTRNIVLGFLLGAIIICGVIVMQFVSDDRIRTGDEIEKYLDMPTLGVMPLQKRSKFRNNLAEKGEEYI